MSVSVTTNSPDLIAAVNALTAAIQQLAAAIAPHPAPPSQPPAQSPAGYIAWDARGRKNAMTVLPIAGGLATPIKHGPVLPGNAEAFAAFVLSVDPEHPVLYISNAGGQWVPCVMGTPV